MPMSVMEVLTLLLLVFNVLSYLDNHLNKEIASLTVGSLGMLFL